ncbi:MAG: GIY-YIG nuclease family protein [Magnetococcales bacterium]|nr:GIY-YIG nuclease family protein [Magnetococcales bacterium]
MATYVLILHCAAPCRVTVGAWGDVTLAAGVHLYVGSARRAWRARVNRHMQSTKKLRWHIDYLLAVPEMQIASVWLTQENRECPTAQTLGSLPGVTLPGRRIGASDCRCPGHFLRLDSPLPVIEAPLRAWGFAPLADASETTSFSCRRARRSGVHAPW